MKDRRQQFSNIIFLVVAGQGGCITLVIVLAALLGGLWLDANFQTRPLFTLILIIGSIPVSLAAMFIVVRGAISKIKAEEVKQKSESIAEYYKEEDAGGRNNNS